MDRLLLPRSTEVPGPDL